MVVYPSNPGLNTVTRIERLCQLGWLEYLPNHCARLDKRLYPVLDTGVIFSLEYKYSVTQLPPGDYYYVKWWDSGPI